MSAYVANLAKKYYPTLWNDSRIDQLLAAGSLTEEEAMEIRGEKGDDNSGSNVERPS